MQGKRGVKSNKIAQIRLSICSVNKEWWVEEAFIEWELGDSEEREMEEASEGERYEHNLWNFNFMKKWVLIDNELDYWGESFKWQRSNNVKEIDNSTMELLVMDDR